MSGLEWIAFDADDTLWHNETLYQETQQRFYQLMADYADPAATHEALYRTEMGNLARYGYGIKSFVLSMIETAIQVSAGRVSSQEIGGILDLGKAMLAAEVCLLPDVRDTVEALGNDYSLMVITKGDLRDQQAKLRQSGLTPFFDHIEIVSEKTAASYREILDRAGIAPERFLMVGNSMRSDVLPVLELGGRAVHVPFHVTWAHEVDTPPSGANRYYALEQLGQLPELLAQLAAEAAGES